MGKKIAVVSAVPFQEPKGYENSYQDWNQDRRDADRRYKTTEEYEDSAHDRIADKAGSKRMRDHEDSEKAIKNEGSYKSGSSAFSRTPKVSHSFGYKGENKKGHLRMSGHSGAHQIGKKR